MDILIQQLRDDEQVTTEEAIRILLEIIRKYSSVLSNVIAIKERTPETEGFLRGGMGSSSELLKELLESLESLGEELRLVEEELIKQSSDAVFSGSATINDKILSLLQIAIKKVHLSYKGKAKSFAMILTELESIHDILSGKFASHDDKCTVEKSSNGDGVLEIKSEIEVGEKYVYARIYHRCMEFIGTSKASSDWLPPLLEALKDPERHGIAIYNDEENAVKSLKDEKYGYVVLRIREVQDITAKRPTRKDPKLECVLLTLAEVTREQIIELVHLGKRYPIILGKVQGIRSEV